MAKAKDGWYILSRSVVDSPVWNCDEPYDKRAAYIDLLLMANYEDKQLILNRSRNAITVHRGQLVTSYDHLANRWRWGKRKVMTYLDQLEQVGLIEKKGTQYGTVLTLVQYEVSGNKGNAHSTARDTADSTVDDTARATSGDTAECTARSIRHKEIKEGKTNGKKDKEINKGAKHLGVFSWEGEPE